LGGTALQLRNPSEILKKETPEWAKVIKDAGIKLGN
jgi:hypothetical protein